MTLHLIIHSLVATVITWIGMIAIIVAGMFSWPYLIACLLVGIIIAIPITIFAVKRINKSK